MYILVLVFVLIIVIAAYVYVGQNLPSVELTQRLAEQVRNSTDHVPFETMPELLELRPYLRRRMKPANYFGEARERVASLNRLRYAIEFLISDFRCTNKVPYDGPLRDLIALEY